MCENGTRNKRAITEIVHIIVNEMRSIKTNIPSKAFKTIANKMISKYLQTFRDVDDDGVVLGDGISTLYLKLHERNSYLNRPHKRGNIDTEPLPSSKRKQKINITAGCSNWNPQGVVNVDAQKELLKIDFATQDISEENLQILESTFQEQRDCINNSKYAIEEFKKEWPVLFNKKVIIWHFNKITSGNKLEDLPRIINEKKAKICILLKKKTNCGEQ